MPTTPGRLNETGQGARRALFGPGRDRAAA